MKHKHYIPQNLATLVPIMMLVLIVAMLTLPAPAHVAAVDPTLDAAQMTFDAARVQATIRARATADAQAATRAAIQQTVAVIAIQQTQVVAEQERSAQETRSALEAQATRQGLELTATAQHYEQSINATGTAIAISATRQAVEAEATRNAAAAQATRQALDEQEIAQQRQRARGLLQIAGVVAIIFCAVALSIAAVITAKRKAPLGQQVVTPNTPVPEMSGNLLVIDVPRTRIVCGDAAEQGARAIAHLLELQEEYDDDPSLDQETNTSRP